MQTKTTIINPELDDFVGLTNSGFMLILLHAFQILLQLSN